MYFIYKQNTGTKPQAGFNHISFYKGTDTWWLVETDKTVEEIQALAIETLIIGEDDDAFILAAYPDLIDQKADEIRAEGSLQLTNLGGAYLSEERETWYTQKEEAVAFLADNNAVTPMLTAMATARGITVGDMAGLIQENMTAFTAAAGTILGNQQAALVNIYTAIDLVTSMSVEFP